MHSVTNFSITLVMNKNVTLCIGLHRKHRFWQEFLLSDRIARLFFHGNIHAVLKLRSREDSSLIQNRIACEVFFAKVPSKLRDWCKKMRTGPKLANY